jgi:hypothetical protein
VRQLTRGFESHPFRQRRAILAYAKRGVRVVTARDDDLTDTSDPSRVMMRQIARSFFEYEKARRRVVG